MALSLPANVKTLFVIDALNFLFRSYYAIQPMTNAQGESTHALFGFIRSVNKLVQEYKPDYLLVVFDGPDNKQSRIALYPEYKGHRKEMPADLGPQIDLAHQFCALAGIPVLCASGVEADDTMGSVATWMQTQPIHTVLCSSDKDLCQLVTESVQVLNPHKDHLLMDREKVKELFGIFPEQLVDYLAICGDASDNIPGLKGFGAKTAAALLNEHGSLEGIFQAIHTFSDKKRELIEQGKEAVLLSRALATIQRDVPFPHTLAFFEKKPEDTSGLRAFYQQMQFVSLLKELSSQATLSNRQRYHLVDNPAALKSVIASLKQEKTLCIDTETTSVRPLEAMCVGIGLGASAEEAWYIPLNGTLEKEETLRMLMPLLNSSEIRWVGHNLKYDLQVLFSEGIELKHLGFDTLLASYLLSAHTQKHNLDDLVLEHFGVHKIPITSLIGKGKQERSMNDVPLQEVCAYCCEDVDYTVRLKELFAPQIETLELRAVFEEIEMPLIAVLARMERAGIFCNVQALRSLSIELSEKIRKIEEKIFALAGHSFNLNSPKQLAQVLFEEMGLTPPKKTQTGFSTAIDVLESLREESPLVEEVISYRSLEKLRSTYAEALPEQIHPRTGRIHCHFNQSVAATGRLSCQDPNLQNIPVRTPEGLKIRAAFEPQAKDHLFLSADYSQIELRLLAHLSEDPSLIRAFQNEEDIHAATAALIFDTPLSSVTQEMRYRAKAVNFGILYGQQAFGLSKQLGVSYQEAEQFIKTYFDRYPRIRQFLEFCKESARKTGRSITLTGRLRPIPDIRSTNPALRSAAERLAVNTPLQGTAADLIKLAMIAIDNYLLEHPSQGKMILQIHDELLFEVPQDQVDSLAKQVKERMESVFPLKVPLVVDISIGKNWGEC